MAHIIVNTLLYLTSTHCHCFLFCTLCPRTFIAAFIWHWAVLVRETEWRDLKAAYIPAGVFQCPRASMFPASCLISGRCILLSSGLLKKGSSQTSCKGFYVPVCLSWGEQWRRSLMSHHLKTMPLIWEHAAWHWRGSMRWNCWWLHTSPIWKQQLNAWAWFEIWPRNLPGKPHSHSFVCAVY